MSLLPAEFLARLESLQLRSRTRLVGRFDGEHRSKRHGNAVDFADFREYHPGDDFRRIDYHVLARLDQVLVKLYEADDEITLRLMLDTSNSMAVGGKMAQAKRIAAALAFVALTTHDTVSVHTFPARGLAPRFNGRAAVAALFAYLEAIQPAGPTPFAEAAGHLISRPGPPGITMVLSDLLTPEWEALVRLRARGSDLTLVHLLARADTDPDLLGDLELVDSEGGARLAVSLTPDVVDAYRQRVAGWQDDIAARCHSVGAAYVPVAAEDDVERLMLTSWRAGGLLR